MDIYQSVHWGWVKTTGKVIWLQTLEGTHTWGRGWHLYLLMLAISKLKEECYHSLNWVMAGKAQINEMGGVKWVSNPCVRVRGQLDYHLDVECSCPLRGTYTNYKGVALFPSEQPDYKRQCSRLCSLKQGGIHGPLRNTPPLTITADSWCTYFGTDSDSCRYKKISIDCIVKTVYSTVWSVFWLCHF